MLRKEGKLVRSERLNGTDFVTNQSQYEATNEMRLSPFKYFSHENTRSLPLSYINNKGS